ncbi:MAG: AI-2E family transporter [Chloroflexota bacterium]
MKSSWAEKYQIWMFTAFVIVFGLLLFLIRRAIGPLVIGALLAYLLIPFVGMLTRKFKRLSHGQAVAIVFILAILILLSVPGTLIPNLVREAQTLTDDLINIYGVIQDWASQPLVIMGREIEFNLVLPDINEIAELGVLEITESAINLIEVLSVNAVWLMMIMATTYYLMRDWSKLQEWLFSLAPDHAKDEARQLLELIKDVWAGYLRGNFVLMLIIGVEFSIVWAIIGLPAALLLGIITGLLTIIPDLGPAIAAAIAVVVALVEGSNTFDMPNLWFAVMVFLIYAVLITIKNFWVRPRLFGRMVHMHEGIVFISIMLAVLIQGILGAIVIVPLLASLRIIGRYLLNKMYNQPTILDKMKEQQKIEGK